MANSKHKKFSSHSKKKGIVTAVEGAANKGYSMGKKFGDIGFHMDIIAAKIFMLIGLVVIIGSIIMAILKSSSYLMFSLFGLCCILIGFIQKSTTDIVKNNSAMKNIRGIQLANVLL
jgi:hypothetical protein